MMSLARSGLECNFLTASVAFNALKDVEPGCARVGCGAVGLGDGVVAALCPTSSYVGGGCS